MDHRVMKWLGVTLVMTACALFFVAWNEYSTNAANARAMNENPMFGALTRMANGGVEVEPTTPDTTKYCGAFGLVALIAGLGALRIGLRSQPETAN